MGQNSPVPDPTPPPPAPPAPPAPPDPAELTRLQTENASQARALALAMARIDFPKADAAILDMFQGTAEGLRALAEKLHAKELEREAALSHSSTAPAPTPGPGGSTTADQAALARYNELKAKVMSKRAEPHEVEEFSNLAYAKGWNQHQADRKVGARA
jgi:pyruvate/2-oxoglutarate dehydrogenase complex dihydrolipoamide acyltransferase (E2) component